MGNEGTLASAEIRVAGILGSAMQLLPIGLICGRFTSLRGALSRNCSDWWGQGRGRAFIGDG